MIFTDEEMRQLKTDIACPYNITHHGITIPKTRLFALLSRLEASEAHNARHCCTDPECVQGKAWRKAAGK